MARGSGGTAGSPDTALGSVFLTRHLPSTFCAPGILRVCLRVCGCVEVGRGGHPQVASARPEGLLLPGPRARSPGPASLPAPPAG